MATYDYKIAVGNDNAAGLTLVSSLVDGTGEAFYMPNGLGFYSEGNVTTNADGSVSITGFASTTWRMSMTSTQYDFWRTTYCAGGYSGLVTIRTTTTQYNSYANFNAVMVVPQVADVQRSGYVYTVDVRMTRMVAL